MTQSMNDAGLKFRERYRVLKQNRPRTVLLCNQQYFSLDQLHNETNICLGNHKTKETKSVIRCRATKMDGNVCNAKVKDGEFCKRHSK